MGFFNPMGLGAFGRGGPAPPQYPTDRGGRLGPYAPPGAPPHGPSFGPARPTPMQIPGNPWFQQQRPPVPVADGWPMPDQGPVATSPGGEGQFGGPPPWMQPWGGGMPWQQMPGLNPTQQRDLLWRSGRAGAAMPLGQFSGGPRY